jgi:hypothetical protein
MAINSYRPSKREKNRMKVLLAIGFATVPVFAFACGQGEAEVLRCKTKGGKPMEICQGPNAVIYRFGAKPDMVVKIPTDQLKWERSNGTSVMADVLYFPNGDTTYVVSRYETFKGPSHEETSIEVMRDDGQLAKIECAQAATSRFHATALKGVPAN